MPVLRTRNWFLFGRHFAIEGVEDMLGILAAVLIVLWLLGFFAFHLTTGVIHIVLVVGIVLLAIHFLRGSSSMA